MPPSLPSLSLFLPLGLRSLGQTCKASFTLRAFYFSCLFWLLDLARKGRATFGEDTLARRWSSGSRRLSSTLSLHPRTRVQTASPRRRQRRKEPIASAQSPVAARPGALLDRLRKFIHAPHLRSPTYFPHEMKRNITALGLEYSGAPLIDSLHEAVVTR